MPGSLNCCSNDRIARSFLSGRQHSVICSPGLVQHEAEGMIINLAGRTDWLQTVAVIRQADLVICNDSGIAHIAAACGTATLAIYSASHEPQEWGPRGNRARVMMALVPCSRCSYEKLEMCQYDHRCMRLISPEAVAAEAVSMLMGL
jgi:ADP-heptose:LPS heptosyltransferase